MEKNYTRYMFYLLIWISCFAINVSPVNAQTLRDNVVSTAQSQIGIKERTGNNDGKVLKYQKPYGAKRLPWCNFFIKWTYDKNGVNTEGMDGRAISSYRKDKRIAFKRARKGDVIYIPTRIGTGHTGIIHTKHKDRVRTIEGNYQDQVSWVVRKAEKTYFATWIQDGTYVSDTTYVKDEIVDDNPLLEPTPVDKAVEKVKDVFRKVETPDKRQLKKGIKYAIGLVIILLLINIKSKDNEKSSG